MKDIIKKINPEWLEFKRHLIHLKREIEKENAIAELTSKDIADFTHKRLYFILIIFGVFFILSSKIIAIILNSNFFDDSMSLIAFLIPVITLTLLIYLMILTVFYVNSAANILGWLGTIKNIEEEYKKEIRRYKSILALTKIYLVFILCVAVLILAQEYILFFNISKYFIFPFAVCFCTVGWSKPKLYFLYFLIGIGGYIFELTFWFYFITLVLVILNYSQRVFERIAGSFFKFFELSPSNFNHTFYPLLASLVIAVPLMHSIITYSTTLTINGPDAIDSSELTLQIDGQYIPTITKISINDKEIQREDIQVVYSKSKLTVDSNLLKVLTPVFYQNDKPNYKAIINIKDYKISGMNYMKIEYIIPSFRQINASITHEFQQK